MLKDTRRDIARMDKASLTGEMLSKQYEAQRREFERRAEENRHVAGILATQVITVRASASLVPRST